MGLPKPQSPAPCSLEALSDQQHYMQLQMPCWVLDAGITNFRPFSFD